MHQRVVVSQSRLRQASPRRSDLPHDRDVYALDASSVEEAHAIVDLFEDRERYDKPFTAKLTSFIDGLLVHFPDAETDPDGPGRTIRDSRRWSTADAAK